jgi:tetratricopeptide (TPR) repeat protein
MWVLLLAPWLLFPFLYQPLTALALLTVPMLWVVRALARRPIHVSTPVNLPLVLLLLSLGVALLTGPQPALAISQATVMVLGVAVVSAFVNGDERWRGVHLWSIILTAAGFVLALFSLVMTDWPEDKIGAPARLAANLPALQEGLGQGVGRGFDPGQVAGGLVILLPIVLGFALHARQRGRQPLMSHWQAIGGAGFLVALFIGVVLVLTQSRTGWVVMMAVATIGLSFRSRPLWVLAVALFVTGAMLLLIGLISGRLGDWMGLVDGLGRQPGAELTAWPQRVELWRAALLGLRDYPLTGAGAGVFMVVAPLNYALHAVRPDSVPAHVPSLWLQAGADLGLLGLIALVWLTTILFLVGWKIRLRRSGQRLLLTGFWLGAVAWMGHGLLTGLWLGDRLGLLIWIVVGVMLGGWLSEDERQQLPRGRGRLVQAGWLLGGLVAAGVLGWLLLSPIWTLNRGAQLLDGARIDDGLAEPERMHLLGEAQSLLSQSGALPGAVRRRAVVEYELGNDAQAAVAFRQDTGAEAYLSSRGRWLLVTDRHEEAERLLGVAREAFPESARLSCLSGDVFWAAADPFAALAHYRHGLEGEGALADEPRALATCYDGLAILAEHLGWWGEAAGSLAKAVTLEPERLDLQVRYGWALFKATGDLGEPVAIEEAVLRAQPDSIAAILALADMHLVGDRPRRALEWAQEAVLMESSNPEGWVRLAMASGALDDFDQARKALNEALRLDPDHPRALDLHAQWGTP